MFTKYQGISLPQNYSGNRFRSYPKDTEMKTHKAQEPSRNSSGVKTSVSPIFQEASKRTSNASDNAKSTFDYQQRNEEDDKEFYEDKSEIIDTSPEKSYENDDSDNQAEEKNDNVAYEETLSDFFSKSGLSKMLNGLHSDDILLLALILILAGEGEAQNPDAIVILSLLLLFR